MGFSFTPPTGLNDTSAFPSRDTNFRAKFQALLQQIPTYYDTQISDLINTASLSTNGWFKDKKTGLIIQWGIATGLSNGTNVVFPIAFPSACYIALATLKNTGTTPLSTDFYAVDKFTVYMTGGPLDFSWIAVGK